MVKENLFTSMEISIKANGRITQLQETEHISEFKEENIQATGKMISQMVTECNNGPMEIFTKEIF